jgi:hypothetical protein
MRLYYNEDESLYHIPTQGCPFIRGMTFHMSCLFIINNYLLFIYFYIFIYIYASYSLIVECKYALASECEMKDLGMMHYFL